VILHPGVLALLVAAAATGGLLLFAAWHAAEIVRGWDLSSGSERQLQLERRTYLVSTLLRWVLAFELVSVFLYVYTADALAPLFTGAMCAAGSLKAGSGGYAVLVLKLVGFVAAGLWLVLNAADERGRDYPLVRRKYGALLAIAPLLVAEAWLLFGYFGSLRPNVITSCCGSLFSQAGTGVGSDLAALSHRAAAAGLTGTAGGSVLAASCSASTGSWGTRCTPRCSGARWPAWAWECSCPSAGSRAWPWPCPRSSGGSPRCRRCCSARSCS
jgi:hypothetical protein